MLKCFNLNLNATRSKGGGVSKEEEKGDTKETLIEIYRLKKDVKAHLASMQYPSRGLQCDSSRTRISKAYNCSWQLP